MVEQDLVSGRLASGPRAANAPGQRLTIERLGEMFIEARCDGALPTLGLAIVLAGAIAQ